MVAWQATLPEVNPMLSNELLTELQAFIEMNLPRIESIICESAPICFDQEYSQSRAAKSTLHNDELENFIRNSRKPSFNQILFGFIDRKGVSDTDIYKKAGIDRGHFSKIRSNPNYRIGKSTVIALVFALKLEREEADTLLNAAGFSLSENDMADLVIQFCLQKKLYDIQEVNQALDYFSLQPLFGVTE